MFKVHIHVCKDTSLIFNALTKRFLHSCDTLVNKMVISDETSVATLIVKITLNVKIFTLRVGC